MITAIVNSRIVLSDRILDGKTLLIDDDKVYGTSDSVPDTVNLVYDAAGCYLSAGFIDIHTHGGGGFDFMDGTVEAVEGACRMHLSHGTTSIVPTTLTCPDDELLNFFKIYREAKQYDGL